MGCEMRNLIVVFSDTHCGSRQGLMLPEHQLVEEPEVTIKATPLQLWLNEAWETLWDKVYKYIDNDSWIAIHVGDCIEGLHHGKRQLVSTDKADHFQIFLNAVYPKIMSASQRYFVLGTEAHGGQTDEIILAKRCKAKKHPVSKRFAENRWLLNLNGFPILFRHHINCTSREYLRSNSLSINLANEQLAAIRRGYTVPRGLVAAHRHMYDYVDTGSDFCLVCGPWQLTTRHGHKNWSPMVPEPTLSIIDSRGKAKGGKPEVITYKATPEGDECVTV